MFCSPAFEQISLWSRWRQETQVFTLVSWGKCSRVSTLTAETWWQSNSWVFMACNSWAPHSLLGKIIKLGQDCHFTWSRISLWSCKGGSALSGAGSCLQDSAPTGWRLLQHSLLHIYMQKWAICVSSEIKFWQQRQHHTLSNNPVIPGIYSLQ